VIAAPPTNPAKATAAAPNCLSTTNPIVGARRIANAMKIHVAPAPILPLRISWKPLRYQSADTPIAASPWRAGWAAKATESDRDSTSIFAPKQQGLIATIVHAPFRQYPRRSGSHVADNPVRSPTAPTLPSPILKGLAALTGVFGYIKSSAPPGCGRSCSQNPLVSSGNAIFSPRESQRDCVLHLVHLVSTKSTAQKGSHGISKSTSSPSPTARPLSSSR
jgi:hypothetical protein